MTKQDVVSLMRESESEQEWNDNCDKVKEEFGGYPDFWFSEIMMAGVLDESKLYW